mmetsp:Transcript_36210/g.91411  ORF Transcript_36210/g.91411 Transcript_36210/m.91411 type:complete len:324 (-) Transcript_36210:393-1364(-)
MDGLVRVQLVRQVADVERDLLRGARAALNLQLLAGHLEAQLAELLGNIIPNLVGVVVVVRRRDLHLRFLLLLTALLLLGGPLPLLDGLLGSLLTLRGRHRLLLHRLLGRGFGLLHRLCRRLGNRKAHEGALAALLQRNALQREAGARHQAVNVILGDLLGQVGNPQQRQRPPAVGQLHDFPLLRAKLCQRLLPRLRGRGGSGGRGGRRLGERSHGCNARGCRHHCLDGCGLSLGWGRLRGRGGGRSRSGRWLLLHRLRRRLLLGRSWSDLHWVRLRAASSRLSSRRCSCHRRRRRRWRCLFRHRGGLLAVHLHGSRRGLVPAV